MAHEIWHNRNYGSVLKSGLERAIDYTGLSTYFAPVRAVILMDQDENLMGDRDSPLFITGGVNLVDEQYNVLGDRDSPVFITGHVTDDWSIVTLSDLTQPDNDKTLTVPLEQEYQFLSAFVTYAAANAGGDRQLQLDFRDANDVVIGQYRPGAVHAVNTTGYYMFAPAVADLDALRDSNYLSTPVAPTTFLSAGEDMRFFDNNAVSNSDIMGIQVRVARRRA